MGRLPKPFPENNSELKRAQIEPKLSRPIQVKKAASRMRAALSWFLLLTSVDGLSSQSTSDFDVASSCRFLRPRVLSVNRAQELESSAKSVHRRQKRIPY